MEIVFTLFRLITSFSVDILYDISLVNNLFNFNLDKRIVVSKDIKIKQNISLKDIPPTIFISKIKDLYLIDIKILIRKKIISNLFEK